MKTISCKQLGGACTTAFRASTFEEIAEMNKKHDREMFQKEDKAHLDIMQKMKELIQSPDAMQQWFNAKRNEFNTLKED